MKNLALIILVALLPFVVKGQKLVENEVLPCTTCDNNQVDLNKGASALGTENISTGINSFASGFQSNAFGDYSVAMGKMAVAIGHKSVALGLHSEASGRSSLALGPYTLTLEDALVSVALGSRVTAGAQRSMVIGFGLPDYPISNTVTNSLMIGFNSDIPTLYVGPSNGVGTYGKVGIGTTSPSELLEVNGNMKVNDYSTLNHLTVEDVIVNNSLNLGGNNLSNIGSLIGGGVLTIQNYITGGPDITITAESNVGIGTDIPTHSLEVDGDFSVSQQAWFQNNIFQTTGYSIQSSQIKAPDTNGLSLTNQSGNGLLVDDAGNVGIGTSAPAYPLDVTGDIRFTGQLYDANGLFKPSPWEKEENNLFYLNGRIGMGTDSLPATLNVGGSIWLNDNLYLDDPEGGLIMRSPNGSCWKLSVSDEGNLTVVPGGCLTSSGSENMLTDEAKEQAVVVFPNPADNEVRIRKVSHGHYFVSILNQQGILLQSVELKRKETSVFLSGYKPGIYIFRISDHNSRIVQTEKVVVR